jgi:hypothetical protein
MAELARSLTAEREERELKEKEVAELKREIEEMGRAQAKNNIKKRIPKIKKQCVLKSSLVSSIRYRAYVCSLYSLD